MKDQICNNHTTFADVLSDTVLSLNLESTASFSDFSWKVKENLANATWKSKCTSKLVYCVLALVSYLCFIPKEVHTVSWPSHDMPHREVLGFILVPDMGLFCFLWVLFSPLPPKSCVSDPSTAAIHHLQQLRIKPVTSTVRFRTTSQL